MTNISDIIAPQAPLEESATTEASRRCSLTGILAGFKDGFGDSFLGICDWYLRFGCPEHGPGAAPDRPDSVCLSVCLSAARFSGTLFWSRSMDVQLSFQKNNHPKTGTCTEFCRGS